MKKFLPIALVAALVASPVLAAESAAVGTTTAVVAAKGQMLLAAGGSRLAPVYRVSADGSPQIIIEGKLVTIPASTLSTVGGKLTTSLTKREVIGL